MDLLTAPRRAYIFDTELTDKRDGQIIEAAWVRFELARDLADDPECIPLQLRADEWFAQRYKPDRPLSCGAMAVHHILPSELDDCPPSSTFALPSDCGYLIGHSIDFDWQAAGALPHIKRICTHAIAQWVWPDATGYSQTALLYMLLGATPETRANLLHRAHRAEGDVLSNRILLQHILRARPEIGTWNQLWLFSEECRIPRTCPMKRNEGVLLEDLDDGFIDWCLGQHWLDPYFRKGLERVCSARHAQSDCVEADAEDVIERGVSC